MLKQVRGYVRFGSGTDIAAPQVMSASPPKADMDQNVRDVRFVPKADIVKSFDLVYCRPALRIPSKNLAIAAGV